MDFQIGDFIEVCYQAQNHACRGEIVKLLPYQMTIIVWYADNPVLKNKIGVELRITIEARDRNIVIQKWESILREEDLLFLMHFALQIDDKDWFESLGEQKSNISHI